MSGMASIFGAALILVASLLFGRGFVAYIKGRAEDYRAVTDFLALMRSEIAERLATPAELAVRAEGGVLAEIGFLGRVAAGASLGDAFRECSSGLSLSTADTELLQSYFDGFGVGSVECELGRLDTALSELSASERAVREETPSRIKLALTLSVLFALGTVILLL